jgi:hypothetical protein
MSNSVKGKKKRARSGYKYQNTQLDAIDAAERRERGLPPRAKNVPIRKKPGKGKRKKK